jgi:hypothetical protein
MCIEHVLVRSVSFWAVTPYSLMESYQCLEGICILLHGIRWSRGANIGRRQDSHPSAPMNF